MTFQDFFFMGGYAWYVWGSYFFVFIVLGITSFLTRVQSRRIKKIISQLRRPAACPRDDVLTQP